MKKEDNVRVRLDEETKEKLKKIADKEIKRYVQMQTKISVSHLQRKFCIGYNRAAKIVEELEENGIISIRDKYGFRTVLRKTYVWNI